MLAHEFAIGFGTMAAGGYAGYKVADSNDMGSFTTAGTAFGGAVAAPIGLGYAAEGIASMYHGRGRLTKPLNKAWNKFSGAGKIGAARNGLKTSNFTG